MNREYVIFDTKPAYHHGGGHHFNAYQTYNRPWDLVCEMLPPDVCNYDLFDGPSKPLAVKEAKRRWGKPHAGSTPALSTRE